MKNRYVLILIGWIGALSLSACSQKEVPANSIADSGPDNALTQLGAAGVQDIQKSKNAAENANQTIQTIQNQQQKLDTDTTP